jgi:hypothetical protein
MFGFGVGFGVGEFGSAGFALEMGDVSVVMPGGTDFTAECELIPGNIVLSSYAQLVAASSLTIDPSGVTVTAKQPRRASTASPVVTAKPISMQTMRVVPQSPRHIYQINRDPTKPER